MSEKMECPVCGSYTSSILRAVAEGEPCPSCGAPADLILQVTELKARNADAALVEQLKDMGVRLGQAEAEAARLRRVLWDVQEAVRDVAVPPSAGASTQQHAGSGD